MHVGGASERRGGIAGQRDERDAEALQYRDQHQDLVGLAGVRQCQHLVLAGDHADVAVAGLGRVQEEGGRAGAREGRGDLAGDVAGLAHAGHDHAAAAALKETARAHEVLVEAARQHGDRFRLDAERTPPELEQCRLVERLRGSGGLRRLCHARTSRRVSGPS